MINDVTIDAVYPLAQKLTAKGVAVEPIPNTPLMSLFAASHYEFPDKGMEEPASHLDALRIGSKAKNAEGVVNHDVVMDEVVEVVSKTVQRNLDIAKNVVNPTVKLVAEKADQLMTAAQELKSNLISVCPDFYHELWASNILEEMVGRYSETPVRAVDLYMELPNSMDREALFSLASTGATRFDGIVRDWFDGLGDEMIENTYRSIFHAGGTHGRRKLQEMINPYHTDRDRILLAHLFARKLYQMPPEGTKVSLDEYREYMSGIVAQTGRGVLAVMRNREQDNRARRLVKVWPASVSMLGQVPLVIVANGDLYNQWLKEGGSPEALFGAFLSDQKNTYQALLDNKSALERIWAQKEGIVETTNRFNRFNHAIEAIVGAVTHAINELDDEELVVDRATLHRRLQDKVKVLRGQFYTDWYGTARRVVCDVMYPHTDAKKILLAIDEASTANPDLDIREAATLATIEYVSLWVAKLCKINYGHPPA